MGLIDDMARNTSLFEIIKKRELEVGYEFDPRYLATIALYLLKLYLIQGGCVPKREGKHEEETTSTDHR